MFFCVFFSPENFRLSGFWSLSLSYLFSCGNNPQLDDSRFQLRLSQNDSQGNSILLAVLKLGQGLGVALVRLLCLQQFTNPALWSRSPSITGLPMTFVPRGKNILLRPSVKNVSESKSKKIINCGIITAV